jgi:preprotein translocase subunit SecA
MSFLNTIFRDESDTFVSKARKTVSKINTLEGRVSKLADLDFPIETNKLKERLSPPAGGGEKFDSILPEAFALVREATKEL